ncbi:DUF6492 family protein [Bosea sp. (in: a-proteobacteria)]|uniref:DUF6492 family protein n=1 Tax=Bosea sp. (in: a-proteobacteria) TaxID=1871050 RepID=UPI0027346DC6|nr:DUF6492 family protein [Bosea sp. (in: a-proteobacteria)]MDP3409159.1 DUF6492 family protein [Bosea sp. (in: a-proteobacteria)]
MIGDLSVVTPSYHGDLERCRLLCDSMDRFCTGHARHYIVVDDEDVGLFAPFAGPGREVIATSALLPPFWAVGRWRGRRYRWRPGIGLPIYGWHLQQLRKIAVTLAQPAERVICIDSDICFCRPADLSGLATSPRVPLFLSPAAITAEQPRHVEWREKAHAALGLEAPPLPGDDFIGPMITWERATVRAMADRIEAVNGQPWWQVLARQRGFSEYLTYGAAVSNDPVLEQRHERVETSPCLTYWTGPALDEQGLDALIGQLRPDQFALTIQSHTQTSIATIRSAVMRR